MMEDHDRDELLKILEDHGKQFLSSFAQNHSCNDEKTRIYSDSSSLTSRTKPLQSDPSQDEFEDWNGFSAGSSDIINEDDFSGAPLLQGVSDILLTTFRYQ
jgi:hypothetical protein